MTLVAADLYSLLEGQADPSDVWRGSVARDVLTDSCGGWLAGLTHWTLFWSLTFDDKKRPQGCTQDVARSLWSWMVRELNRDLFGKRYMAKVGASYFSFALAIEWTPRDVPHLHVLTDRPVDIHHARELWYGRCGWPDVQKIKDSASVCAYVAKYVSKSGVPDVVVTRYRGTPVPRPDWWIE
jgi:hypothetical protein